MNQSRFLMCPPTFFGVEYVINPWMEGQVHATNVELARTQWMQLSALLQRQAKVISLPAVQGLPDLVFTANAAVIFRGTAVVSTFRFAERQPESPHFASWLEADGFHVRTLPPDVFLEGAGDALLDRSENLLWLGHSQRSDVRAKEDLENILGLEVQPLRLRNPSFYHLDTCFCPLEQGFLLYYPGAFDDEGKAAIEARIPANRRIPVSALDAGGFACNAVNLGRTIILNHASRELIEILTSLGFEVTCTPLTEFIRAGGAAKCLSLKLDEPGTFSAS